MIERSISAYRDSFRDLSRETWVLSVVTLINRSGTMVVPFLSVYLKTVLGFSLMQVGWIMAVFGCGSLIGSYMGGKLTDKLGHVQVQFWSLFLSGWFYILLMWVQAFEHWLIAVFFLSIIADAFRPASMAAIADYSTSENRVRSLSLLRLAINLGWSAGPAVGGLVASTMGYKGLFLLDGLTCLTASAVFFLFLGNKRPIEKNRPPQPSPLKPQTIFERRFFVFLIFHLLVLLSFIQIIFSLPVYFKEHLFLDEFQIGLLMAFNGLLIVVFEMPLIFKLEKKAGILQWMALGAGLIGSTYLLFFFFPSWSLVVILAMITLSMGEIFYMPFSNSFALNFSQPENRGTYMGWYTMAGSVAFMLGPVIGLQLTSVVGYPTLWILLTLICLIPTLAWLYREKA